MGIVSGDCGDVLPYVCAKVMYEATSYEYSTRRHPSNQYVTSSVRTVTVLPYIGLEVLYLCWGGETQ